MREEHRGTLDERAFGLGAVDLKTTNGTTDGTVRNFWIASDSGTLDIVGQIAGSNAGTIAVQGNTINKTGLGTIRYSGADANLITGQTTIQGGTLELNKTATVNALAGTVVVGDGGGGAGAETLRWIANDQIPAITVIVAPSGNLDLNGQTDTIGSLNLQRIKNLAPTINTTGLTIDTLNLNNVGATDDTTMAAVINGTLGLTAVRNFNIDDALRIGSGDDLVINAVIGGAGGGITKNGFGTLVLTGNNTYTGATTVSTGVFTDGITRLGGSLIIRGDGDIAQSSSVTVNVGASLVLDNSLGLALDAAGRIGNSAGITLAGGELVHIGHATLPVIELVGSITVNAASTTAGGGTSLIRSIWNGANVELTGVNLARVAGGTVQFVAEGADLGGAANRVRFTGTMANISGTRTLNWATLDQFSTPGLEFVTHDDTTDDILTGAFVTSLAAAILGTENVKLSADESLAAPATVNALMITGSRSRCDRRRSIADGDGRTLSSRRGHQHHREQPRVWRGGGSFLRRSSRRPAEPVRQRCHLRHRGDAQGTQWYPAPQWKQHRTGRGIHRG